MTKETRNDNRNRYQESANAEAYRSKTAGKDNSDGMSELMAKRRISGVDQIVQKGQD